MKHTIAGLALAFAIAAAAGCGGSQKPSPAKAPSCADAAAHTHALYMASPDADAGAADIIRSTFNERCNADGWSADAVACMATASQDEMSACAAKLTDEQKANLAQAASAGGGE